MNPKISIIVPVYRVEPYLRKCIDSILNQTFKDFELILVDDGSPDKCGEICEEYAQKDNRIVVIHQENAGQASARNVGLEIAKGDYIGFVDSDDWIEAYMYELLYKKITSCNADIVIIGLNEVSDKKILSTHIPKNIDLEYILKRAHPCDKLFDKNLFISHKFRFKDGMYFEDLELIPQIYMNAREVAVVNAIGYNYLQREDSTVHQKNKKILDQLRAYLSLNQYINSNENLKLKYSDSFNRGLIYFKGYYFDVLSQYPNYFIVKYFYFIYLNLIKLNIIELKDFFMIPYLKLNAYKYKKK